MKNSKSYAKKYQRTESKKIEATKARKRGIRTESGSRQRPELTSEEALRLFEEIQEIRNSIGPVPFKTMDLIRSIRE